MTMTRSIYLSQFDPDDITVADLAEFPASIEVDAEGILKVTGSKGTVTTLGTYIIPAGLYLASGEILSNGRVRLRFSDGTETLSDPILVPRNVNIQLNGTGVFKSVSGNTLNFSPLTVSHPFRIEDGVISKIGEGGEVGMATWMLDPSKYVGMQLRQAVVGLAGATANVINYLSLNHTMVNTLGATIASGGVRLPVGAYYAQISARQFFGSRGVPYTTSTFTPASTCFMRDSTILATSDTSSNNLATTDASRYILWRFNNTVDNALYRVALDMRDRSLTNHNTRQFFGRGPGISANNPTNVFAQLEIWRLGDI
jgi:hypothetical protein